MFFFCNTVSIKPQVSKFVCVCVAGKASRTEKFLGACAAGKWVLHKSYMEACRAERRFIEVRLDSADVHTHLLRLC